MGIVPSGSCTSLVHLTIIRRCRHLRSPDRFLCSIIQYGILVPLPLRLSNGSPHMLDMSVWMVAIGLAVANGLRLAVRCPSCRRTEYFVLDYPLFSRPQLRCARAVYGATLAFRCRSVCLLCSEYFLIKTLESLLPSQGSVEWCHDEPCPF